MRGRLVFRSNRARGLIGGQSHVYNRHCGSLAKCLQCHPWICEFHPRYSVEPPFSCPPTPLYLKDCTLLFAFAVLAIVPANVIVLNMFMSWNPQESVSKKGNTRVWYRVMCPLLRFCYFTQVSCSSNSMAGLPV